MKQLTTPSSSVPAPAESACPAHLVMHIMARTDDDCPRSRSHILLTPLQDPFINPSRSKQGKWKVAQRRPS
jgi:hypothetical protein